MAALAFSVILVDSARGAAADGGSQATRATITEVRLGRHAAYERLVIDLTGTPDFRVVADGPAAFTVFLAGVDMGAGVAAALARAGRDGFALESRTDPLRLTLRGRHPRFIHRAFVLPPDRPGAAWRLVVDLTAAKGAARPVPAVAAVDLPDMHGMTPDREPVPAARDAVPRPAATPSPTPAAPKTEVAWDRAKRILEELRTHAAPEAERALPPQLDLPERYRRTTVPLR